MDIVVKEIKPSSKGWCSIVTEIYGKTVWLSLSPKLNISPKVGEIYDIEFIDKSFTGKDGKLKTGHEITKIAISQSIPQSNAQSPKEPQNQAKEGHQDKPSKYSNEEIKAFRQKDLQMIRMCALKCSVGIVEANSRILAVSDLCKGMSKEEISGWLSAIRKADFQNFLKEIEMPEEWVARDKDGKEIPF